MRQSKNKLILKTPLGEYRFDELSFSGEPDLSILKKYGVDTSKSKYLKDPKQFLDKLKQDYK